jgi:tetratricopeptide (TPR) repeat protein
MTALPRYRTDPSASGLAIRLRALLTAGVPVACGVHAGLAAPGPNSPLHARITHAIASAFAAGNSAGVPRFEPPPSAHLRLLTAASWGRLDALDADMTAFPADLATSLWWRVHERTYGPLSAAERRVACDLLLRLGYPQRAAAVIELSMIDARKLALSPSLAVEQLAVLRCHLPASAVEALALRGARSGLPPETRRDLALFVVLRAAARGADSTSLRAGAALAVKASSELALSGFTAALQRARLHRAIAAVPFVRRDIGETHRLLGRALDCLTSATPDSEVDRLAWEDEAYALHSLLARTHLAAGLPRQAVEHSAHLVSLSAFDDRTWALRGDALVACGRLDEAVEAYTRGVALGGCGAARAAYLRGHVLERLGRVAEAAESYVLSQRIDPTASASIGRDEQPQVRAEPRARAGGIGERREPVRRRAQARAVQVRGDLAHAGEEAVRQVLQASVRGLR